MSSGETVLHVWIDNMFLGKDGDNRESTRAISGVSQSVAIFFRKAQVNSLKRKIYSGIFSEKRDSQMSQQCI